MLLYYFLFCLITLQTDPRRLPSLLPVLPSHCFTTPASPVLKGGCKGYQPTLAPQVTLGLSISLPIEVRQGRPDRGKGSKGRQQRVSTPIVRELISTYHHQATYLLHTCRECKSVHGSSLVGGSVSGNSHGPGLVYSLCLLVVLLTPLVPLILPPTHSQKILRLLFSCGSLQLFPSAVG